MHTVEALAIGNAEDEQKATSSAHVMIEHGGEFILASCVEYYKRRMVYYSIIKSV